MGVRIWPSLYSVLEFYYSRWQLGREECLLGQGVSDDSVGNDHLRSRFPWELTFPCSFLHRMWDEQGNVQARLTCAIYSVTNNLWAITIVRQMPSRGRFLAIPPSEWGTQGYNNSQMASLWADRLTHSQNNSYHEEIYIFMLIIQGRQSNAKFKVTLFLNLDFSKAFIILLNWTPPPCMFKRHFKIWFILLW